ncbi:STY0301 family protein [Dyella flagellata]|uniref:STY0301 family protein n=1 Tax=Dyella flagellata TaxID=1867833 RepID=UPI0024E0D7EE|nr:STY0301 family protein [Dyella flagellata]
MKFLLALVLLVPAMAQGAEQKLECPASLEVKDSASAPSGAQVFQSPEPHVLERVSFQLGTPSKLVPAPLGTVNKPGESRDTWVFHAPLPQQVWAACAYTGTSLFLVRPVGQNVTRCEVRYRTVGAHTRVGVIAARCE